MGKSKQNRNRKANAASALACAVAFSPAGSLLAAVADVQASRSASAPVDAAVGTVDAAPVAPVEETPAEARERLYPDFSMSEQFAHGMDVDSVGCEGVLRFRYSPVRDVACEICGVPYGEVGVGGAPDFVRSHEMHLMDRDPSGFIPKKQAQIERNADLDIFDDWEDAYDAHLGQFDAIAQSCSCPACQVMRTEEGAANIAAWKAFADAHMADKPFVQIMLAYGCDADADLDTDGDADMDAC